MEEVNNPNLVIGVTCLRGYLLALGKFKMEKVPQKRHMIVQIQALAYLMGDSIGVGFGYVLWVQVIIIS